MDFRSETPTCPDCARRRGMNLEVVDGQIVETLPSSSLNHGHQIIMTREKP